jgi:hypothetical protein
MDLNKTEEPSEPQSGEKVLPRGLEHVSNLFISRPAAGRVIHENSPSGHVEQSKTRQVESSVTAVLRPSGFPVREQLVSVLRRQTAALEDGMRAIDANLVCENSGSIEVLAVDVRNRIAIIDVDDHPNDALLLRGIDHFDWIVRNISNVRRMYQGHVIDFTLQPRVFLVAPEFSPLSRSVTRHMTSLQINCLKYHAVALSSGVGIFFEEIFQSVFQEARSRH